MYAAFRDVARPLYSMALLDGEAVGGAIHSWEHERGRGTAYLARRLDAQGLLRHDLTVEEASSLLWVLTSFDAFDLLFTGRGLPVDEVVRLLDVAAERALLP